MILKLEEVFVTEGVPPHTFVRPPNYVEILLDVRRPGKPVIIEGQSGTGKTTAIKQIMIEVGLEKVTYLSARLPSDLPKIEEVSVGAAAGVFVIDDFHRLNSEIQTNLADLAKMAAELGDAANLPKIVIIGINQVGSDLIQLVPDIAKRIGIHRIQPGTKEAIIGLIETGSNKLNIQLENPETIFEESRGDYWLTQQLCQTVCAISGTIETQQDKKKISIDLPAVRNRVASRLSAAYYPAVKEFCRGRRFRPSNDPYYKLLRTVGQQDSSVADLNELANALPDVRGSINNIKEHRLAVLIDSKESCKKLFYYNPETKNFAIEDPALFYFLKHVDWNALRKDCGFRDQAKAREFDIAISFAGENRQLAKHIAEQLSNFDMNVFFDEYYEANYLGRAWRKQFQTIFSEESDKVIVLLDVNHREKIWPTFERECFVARVADGDVIPIFLDDTIFVGISADIVGIKFRCDFSQPNWKEEVDKVIVEKLIDRLDS